MKIGTIYATEKQLEKMDMHADKQARARLVLGEKALGAFDKREEQGEVRYYDGENRFAIIGRSNRVQWFERRADGWYAVR